MSDLFCLSDAQMAWLAPGLSNAHGKARGEGRPVLGGVIFFNCNGLRRRDAPKEYGPHKTRDTRWTRWRCVAERHSV